MFTPITTCTVHDYHQILTHFDQFWDREAVRALHHPMFVHEFGNTAFVMKQENAVIAYLFGFFAQSGPTAYVHLIGVHQSQRRRGLGGQLIEYFADVARENGCTHMKAITTPQNLASIAFHQQMGFQLVGDASVDGVPIVQDYSGIGHDRVVMMREL